MKASIIIPVYNEAPHLKRFFENLLKTKFPCPVEFVVIDDCSSDGSWEILESFVDKEGFLVLRQPVNQGKSAALKRGIDECTGDIIAVQDADFEYEPQELAQLMEPLLQGKADVVYGSRFLQPNPQVHRTFHYLGNKFLTLLSNILSGLYLSDMETCYKIFRADLLKALPIKTKRFGFEPEVTAYVAKLKLRVQEYPVSYHPRNYESGKKITWKDGLSALWFILKFNLAGFQPEEIEKIPSGYRAKGRQWL